MLHQETAAWLLARGWVDVRSHNYITYTADLESGQQIINNTRPIASLALDITTCFTWILDNLRLTGMRGRYRI